MNNYTLKGLEYFYLATPEIFLFFSVLLLIPLNLYFFKNENLKNSTNFSFFSIIVTGFLIMIIPNDGKAFNDLFLISDFQKYVKLLILLTVIFVLLISKNKSILEGINFPEFNVLILLSTIGMLFAVSANNLMLLFLSIELQALPVYILCALRRNDIKSSEAGLKYFILGALSSGLLLYGMSLIFGFTGSLNYIDILNYTKNINIGLSFGLVFIVSGLAFKISAAPFHMWAPDVYQGSPTPITLFIASAPKITSISILCILTYQVFKNISLYWNDLIIVLSLASIIVGSIGALIQSSLKRLLAYSSIAHIGFILIGVVSFSKSGIEGVMFYLTVYLFLLVGIFSVILSLKKDNRPIDMINDLKGLSKNYPFLSVSLLIFMFAMAGIPPLSGFFSKWFVFYSAIESSNYTLAIIGIVFSVVAAFYYLKIIKIMFFEVSDDNVILDQDFHLKIILFICVIFTSFIFLFIPILKNYIFNSVYIF